MNMSKMRVSGFCSAEGRRTGRLLGSAQTSGPTISKRCSETPRFADSDGEVGNPSLELHALLPPP